MPVNATIPATKASLAARRPAGYLDGYLALCTAFPLAPITSKSQLREAGKVMDRLAVIDEDKATQAEADYLAVLTDLYEAGERLLFPDAFAEIEASAKQSTGLDVLKYLCEQHHMSGGDLGRLLGNRQLGNAILRGDRQLSKSNIRVLAAHFCVSADVLMRE